MEPVFIFARIGQNQTYCGLYTEQSISGFGKVSVDTNLPDYQKTKK